MLNFKCTSPIGPFIDFKVVSHSHSQLKLGPQWKKFDKTYTIIYIKIQVFSYIWYILFFFTLELRFAQKADFRIMHVTFVESRAEHVYVLKNVHLFHSVTVIWLRNHLINQLIKSSRHQILRNNDRNKYLHVEKTTRISNTLTSFN